MEAYWSFVIRSIISPSPTLWSINLVIIFMVSRWYIVMWLPDLTYNAAIHALLEPKKYLTNLKWADCHWIHRAHRCLPEDELFPFWPKRSALGTRYLIIKQVNYDEICWAHTQWRNRLRFNDHMTPSQMTRRINSFISCLFTNILFSVPNIAACKAASRVLALSHCYTSCCPSCCWPL